MPILKPWLRHCLKKIRPRLTAVFANFPPTHRVLLIWYVILAQTYSFSVWIRGQVIINSISLIEFWFHFYTLLQLVKFLWKNNTGHWSRWEKTVPNSVRFLNQFLNKTLVQYNHSTWIYRVWTLFLIVGKMIVEPRMLSTISHSEIKISPTRDVQLIVKYHEFKFTLHVDQHRYSCNDSGFTKTVDAKTKTWKFSPESSVSRQDNVSSNSNNLWYCYYCMILDQLFNPMALIHRQTFWSTHLEYRYL